METMDYLERGLHARGVYPTRDTSCMSETGERSKHQSNSKREKEQW